MSTSRASRDGRFALGALLLTLIVPGALFAGASVFGEERARFGVLVGWGMALAIMVPSYLLLVRSVDSTDSHRFLRSFMLGTMLRLLLTVTAVLLFATQVEQPPVKSFVLTFFLGYMLLTGLELVTTVGGRARGVSA